MEAGFFSYCRYYGSILYIYLCHKKTHGLPFSTNKCIKRNRTVAKGILQLRAFDAS